MPKTKLARRATYVVLAGNVLLLVLKAAASSASDSLAIFSETVHSLTDVVASVAVLVTVRLALKDADERHPFGHSRAEPIGGLVVAIFTGIMGWEVLRSPIDRLLDPADSIMVGPYAFPVLVFTFFLKIGMAWYLLRSAKALRSPALKASAIDCRNDTLLALLAMGGVGLANLNPAIDSTAAVLIGCFILYNAYAIGRENIDYLMGSTPREELRQQILEQAREVGLVRDVRDVRAHYVGNFVHVELAIVLDGALSTHDSHEAA